MILPTNYWKIQLPSISDKKIDRVKEFFELQFPSLSKKTTLSVEDNKQIQTVLLEVFRKADDVKDRALAGLCLRCYVSHQICITCRNIPNIYNISGEKLFTHTDLLPLVLNDDGKALVILDSQGKTQHILNYHDNTTQLIPKGAELFSVNILQKYNPDLVNNENLDNWVKRLTCHNENIRSFLWEFGLATPSDWGLLCKTIPRPLSKLFSAEELEIIKAFQTVYQRDRIKTRQKGRCSEPTQSQLQEILSLLQQKNLVISVKELINNLKQIAEILRQDWLYKKTGSTKTVSIEVYNDSTNNYFANPELPYYKDRDLEDIELEKFQKICKQLFDQTLDKVIAEVVQQRIEELRKSKAYNNFAQCYPEGLRLYYQENVSLGDISKKWKIEWSKARRIFQLENFLDIVQYRTEEAFLEQFLKLLNKSQIAPFDNEPENLKNIVESIREFVFSKAFKEAKAELLASKKQTKNSLFAQKIRIYLDNLYCTA
ncbi:hypothetical protein DSM106972_090770 [Dulcicalothrix desertica PCC 7102]|uniref:Uncharacterized protein n=1 Tax=Dulcicalothrix desertica PCC 7102 TaxID=232991 RepID=A0A3S1AM55_9CYAN|nr:hypothetical protein [Dulcicalothrix desertica]RUS95301.1 hypothetical protein DSM106972_090770 [Dulcicalothrix desertica PCC 7102]TWH43989.1 hypothetical protein CAL7102_07752 [Dulcicalothrix desertica PCC 7102]